MTNFFVKKNQDYTLTVSKTKYVTHTEPINITVDTIKNITLDPITENVFAKISYKKSGQSSYTYDILGSIDGTTFTKISAFSNCSSSLYINRIQNSLKWFAVDTENEKFYISDNGDDWYEKSFISGIDWTVNYSIGIFHINGTYYITDIYKGTGSLWANDVIYTTTDFQTYNPTTLSLSQQPSISSNYALHNVKYIGNGTFFGIKGNAGYISTNGTTWTYKCGNTTYNYSGCQTDGNGFVLCFPSGSSAGTISGSVVSYYIYNYGASSTYSAAVQFKSGNTFVSKTSDYIVAISALQRVSGWSVYKVSKNNPESYSEITFSPPTDITGYSPETDYFYGYKNISGITTLCRSTGDYSSWGTFNLSGFAPSGATNFSAQIYTSNTLNY